ncbi:unnamed protein product [Leuciscus chuanchicus]
MSVHCRVPPGSDAPAASAATAPAAAASQGKPSLRRIKGRIHRSKSLDSIDLLDCNAYAAHGQAGATVSAVSGEMLLSKKNAVIVNCCAARYHPSPSTTYFYVFACHQNKP